MRGESNNSMPKTPNFIQRWNKENNKLLSTINKQTTQHMMTKIICLPLYVIKSDGCVYFDNPTDGAQL